MQIGLQIYFGGESANPEFISKAAAAVEERGFHEIWLAEHIVLPPQIESRYPYSADGSFPYDPRLLPIEPFTALAFMAAHTTTLRLATGVSVLPQRHPVFAAKQAADVDVLSNGRLDYGMGAGWCLEEIAALGTPPGRRGARMDDYIRLMRALWADELSEHRSEFYDLPPIHMAPKPVQSPHPPLFIGGNNRAAMRRAAELGDGWFAAAVTPAQFAEGVAALQAACAAAERLPSELRLAVGPPDGKATLDMVKQYRDAGADQVILAQSGRNLDRFLARLDALAEQVVVPASGL
ncbi:MAG TPA: LLM class F420-dependent oxidoreductase [Alphaproteobacteria bacterium]|nr:LLM class F420-dependent oxidoreductase [Alphaproteobacteria bacterium]